MYYDRTIDDPLKRTLDPGGSLAWLMDHVRSGEGGNRYAHLQFRRARGSRRRGSVQLYWGRTSPLEFRLLGDGQVKLHAHATYGELSEPLFSEPLPIDRLGALRDEFRAHLERAWRVLGDSSGRRRAFVSGEAVCHAGLMRRYGHDWRSDEPLVAIDSEARIGFCARGRREALDADIRTQLRLADAEPTPTKLDALGILPSGDIALIEIKDAGGSIHRAIVQAAVHLLRHRRLLDETRLPDALRAMIDQKTATNVIPPGCTRPAEKPRIVPCVAAPDTSPDWPARWRRAFNDCGPELRAILGDLVFIRLDRHGRILELQPP